MSQPIVQRISYHPDPRAPSSSDRKVQSRFDFIRSKIDFQDKVVLDLGCSGGFFSFALARTAKKVIAIDGDREIIERNKAIQCDLGLRNIEFVCAPISPDVIAEVGYVDVALFLSVFHHMLTASDAYDWNQGVSSAHIAATLAALHTRSRTLVFEIGEPTEGYEWCERMPKLEVPFEEYVARTVFGDCYDKIEVYPSPISINWINRQIISRLGTPYKEDSRFISGIKRAAKFDARDLRKIYIGRRV